MPQELIGVAHTLPQLLGRRLFGSEARASRPSRRPRSGPACSFRDQVLPGLELFGADGSSSALQHPTGLHHGRSTLWRCCPPSGNTTRCIQYSCFSSVANISRSSKSCRLWPYPTAALACNLCFITWLQCTGTPRQSLIGAPFIVGAPMAKGLLAHLD